MPWLIVLTNGHQLRPLFFPFDSKSILFFSADGTVPKEEIKLADSEQGHKLYSWSRQHHLSATFSFQRFYPETKISSPGNSVNSFLTSFSYHFVTGISSFVTVWFYCTNIMPSKVFSSSIVVSCSLNNL